MLKNCDQERNTLDTVQLLRAGREDEGEKYTSLPLISMRH